jgi:hypothetical protein
MRSALLLALLLWALPAGAADDTWSDSDVEAADRYRAEERARAERYREQLEAPRGETPAPAPSGRSARAPSPDGVSERVASSLRSWLEGLLADLVRAIAEGLRAALDEVLGAFRSPHERTRHELAPRERSGLGGWLGREEKRADDWLAGRPPAAPPAPESVREWQQREAERSRELAKREAEEARERARREEAAQRDARDPERERWEQRWDDADAWREEERARLEAAGRAND